MSVVKVVDLNNEEGKETPQQSEEVRQDEFDDNEPTNEVEEVKEVKQEVEEQPKEEEREPPPKPVRAQDKLVRCPKCNREMKLKSFRYGHEQKCQGTLEQKPVKPHTNPRPKQQSKPKPKQPPKPPPDVYYSESEVDEDAPQQPMLKK